MLDSAPMQPRTPSQSQSKAPYWFWPVWFLTLGANIGFGLGMEIAHPFYNELQPVNLTSKELSFAQLTKQTQPIDILVKIVPVDQIADICGDKDAYACSRAYNNPCTVWIPADQEIVFDPQSARASWEDPFDGNTLAHEFLHCYFPNWHQPFTDLENKLKKE